MDRHRFLILAKRVHQIFLDIQQIELDIQQIDWYRKTLIWKMFSTVFNSQSWSNIEMLPLAADVLSIHDSCEKNKRNINNCSMWGIIRLQKIELIYQNWWQMSIKKHIQKAWNFVEGIERQESWLRLKYGIKWTKIHN